MCLLHVTPPVQFCQILMLVLLQVFKLGGSVVPHRYLRQEVTILQHLRHPSLVSMLGVCLRPHRSLVMELAQKGSLKKVLDSNQHLSRGMQHRIALQVPKILYFCEFTSKMGLCNQQTLHLPSLCWWPFLRTMKMAKTRSHKQDVFTKHTRCKAPLKDFCQLLHVLDKNFSYSSIYASCYTSSINQL